MWDEVLPIDQNGVITMYEVMYTPLEDFGVTILANTTIIPEQSTVLQNLQEYVNYSISVRAFTGIGMGPFSSTLIVLTLEDGEIYFPILKLILLLFIPNDSFVTILIVQTTFE